MFVSLIALAAAAADVPAAVPPDPHHPRTEKVICKTFQKTGSLVQRYKACKSAKDWAREHDQVRENNSLSDSCRDRANGGGGCAF